MATGVGSGGLVHHATGLTSGGLIRSATTASGLGSDGLVHPVTIASGPSMVDWFVLLQWLKDWGLVA